MPKQLQSWEQRVLSYLLSTLLLIVVACMLGLYLIDLYVHPRAIAQQDIPVAAVEEPIDEDRVENGLDVETGFVAEGDYLLVKRTCVACHSSKLVLQNRATAEGWREMIRWMQETQKLWDLGENEDKIVAYLAKYLGPEKKSRRANLVVDEWYELE